MEINLDVSSLMYVFREQVNLSFPRLHTTWNVYHLIIINSLISKVTAPEEL
jgi:hypothetical protein